MLGSHNIWKQVQRLDIAVEKSRIFIRAQLQRTRIVQRLPWETVISSVGLLEGSGNTWLRAQLPRLDCQ